MKGQGLMGQCPRQNFGARTAPALFFVATDAYSQSFCDFFGVAKAVITIANRLRYDYTTQIRRKTDMFIFCSRRIASYYLVLTPKRVTLNYHESPFCVNFFFVLTSEAWLSKFVYS